MDVGTYSTANMRDETELVWVDAENDFWWVNDINGIKFGEGHNVDDAWILRPYRAIIDSGSSCSYIPPIHYAWIMGEILKDIEGAYENT